MTNYTPEPDARPCRVNVRLTEAEYDRLVTEAGGKGKMGRYIRWKLFEEKPEDRQTIEAD
jgi:hypothetical protein